MWIIATILATQKSLENSLESMNLVTMHTSSTLHLDLVLVMGFCHISQDLKLAAIRMYENDILDLGDILRSLQFSHRTFYHIWKLWRETGDVVKPKKFHGRFQSLEHKDIQYFKYSSSSVTTLITFWINFWVYYGQTVTFLFTTQQFTENSNMLASPGRS